MITISNSGREFEPHHRSPLTKTMIDNWHNERNIVIENWQHDYIFSIIYI